MANLKMNIERECKVCGNVFRAATLDSFYCSSKCSKVAWKRKHDADIVAEKLRQMAKEVDDLSTFITVQEAASLYNITKTSLYRLIRSGKIPSVRVGARMVRINRIELEKLVEPLEVVKGPRLYNMEPEACYTIGEVCEKYKINDSSVWAHVRKYSIPSRQIGNYVYVPKEDIDKLYRK